LKSFLKGLLPIFYKGGDFDYPDFAERFARFPAYYGLLMTIADGIQGTSYVIFSKLSYRLNV
jgi:hypothetical protein